MANRLGIGQLKWELEDLAFRYQQPAQYKTLAKAVAAKRSDRDHHINQIIHILNQAVSKAGIKHAQITGRAKHIYSIHRKMERKKVGFDQIYDISAVRVLVDSIAECYSVLGIVHNLWQPIKEEFDDYINKPKPNGYRSLHTAVIGPDNNNLEVQIRTRAMHEESELGIAAHWVYKENEPHRPAP